jgi:endogenous inhibitor of DNA gyrase (YacG/DUF329 family)
MKCPTCRKPTTFKDNPFRPFCSERCKLLDFGAWVNEEYTVPSHESAPSLEETEQNSVPSGDEQAENP